MKAFSWLPGGDVYGDFHAACDESLSPGSVARLGNKVAAKHRQKEFVTVGSPKYYSDPPPPSATFLQKASRGLQTTGIVRSHLKISPLGTCQINNSTLQLSGDGL